MFISCMQDLRHLCMDTNDQLFCIMGFLAMLPFFSICDILQAFSSPGASDGSNLSFFFPWPEIGVCLRQVHVHALMVPNLTYNFILSFQTENEELGPKAPVCTIFDLCESS